MNLPPEVTRAAVPADVGTARASQTDGQSPTERADPHKTKTRRRTITRTALSGVLTKTAAFLPALGIAPLAVHHLGTERFGVLMTVLSLVAFLSIADMGIGGSLVTGISRAVGAGNSRRVRLLQANGLVAVMVISLLMSAAAAVLALSSVGSLVFPQSAVPVQQEATRALAVFTFLFALGLPTTLVAKIQLGLQQGHVANNWQTLAGLLNFAGGTAACLLNASVPWIIAGLLAGTLSCGIANSICQFNADSTLRPALADVRRRALRYILRDSALYLALQLIFVATYAADTLIVARKLGAADASSYALAERLFSIVAVAISVFTGPLWAAYGEAMGSGDHAWARRCLRVSIWRVLLAGSAISGGVLLLIDPLIMLFGAGQLKVPIGLAVAMALWRVVEAVGGTFSVYLLASKAIRVVLLAGAVTAAASLLAKIYGVTHFGPAMLPIATSACYVFLTLVPCWWYLRRQR